MIVDYFYPALYVCSISSCTIFVFSINTFFYFAPPLPKKKKGKLSACYNFINLYSYYKIRLIQFYFILTIVLFIKKMHHLDGLHMFTARLGVVAAQLLFSVTWLVPHPKKVARKDE